MSAHLEEFGVPKGVEIVEVYNGGSRDNEDQVSIDMAQRLGYRGIGGSDAHIVSHIGRCGTRFEEPIASEQELVAALLQGAYEPIKIGASAT